MSALRHPVGPEQESTYWVRRILALLAVVLAIVLLTTILGSLFSRNTPSTSSGSSPSTGSSAGVSGASASPTASAVGTAASGGGSLSASGSSTSSDGSLAGTTGSASTPACDPTAVTVKLTGSTPVKIGSTTSLAVNLVNNSDHRCRVDFATTPFQLTISSGIDRIWSTADCSQWGLTGSVTIVAQGAYAHVFRWPTLRSGSGCQLRSQTLGSGTYVAQAGLSGGPGAVFVMTLSR